MTASNVSRMPAKKSPAKKAAAAKAREAEAGDGYLAVEQNGVELRFPVAGKVPLKAYIAFRDGDDIEGTKLLLGPDQWAAFLDSDPTIDDFEAIGNKLQALSGN